MNLMELNRDAFRELKSLNIQLRFRFSENDPETEHIYSPHYEYELSSFNNMKNNTKRFHFRKYKSKLDYMGEFYAYKTEIWLESIFNTIFDDRISE